MRSPRAVHREKGQRAEASLLKILVAFGLKAARKPISFDDLFKQIYGSNLILASQYSERLFISDD